MKNKKHTPLLAALATLVVLLAGVVLIWLAKVRPDVGKGRSEIVTDFLRAALLQDGQTATQVFTYDKDILTIGLEFYLPGDQPCGALDVVLYDADTGEELSRSVGTMDYIVPDQYTTLGMDPAVTGQEGRRYKLAVTPHYATDAILAIGHSDGVALWKEQMAVDDHLTATRSTTNCRPTRTRFCMSSVRRQYFWPMCCILALRPRCFWGGLQICCSLRRWRRWRSRPRRSASGSLPWPRCCP